MSLYSLINDGDRTVWYRLKPPYKYYTTKFKKKFQYKLYKQLDLNSLFTFEKFTTFISFKKPK